MFFNKPKVTEQLKEQPKTKDTITICREQAQQYDFASDFEYEHIVRYAKTLSRDLNEVHIKPIIDSGFVWKVNLRFIHHFLYAALVWSDSNRDIVGNYYDVIDRHCLLNNLVYVGDIPDFALENIAKAKLLNIGIITIHSNFPLPSRLAKTDPVLVGWVGKFDILLNRSNTVYNSQYYVNPPIGFILGIWDNDKELEI